MQMTTVDTIVGNIAEDRETVAATLDMDSLPFLLGALTSIYPNMVLAILREYSTNALDSHVGAGQTRPIEITLPSEHDTNLRVQDFGLGMDKDALRKFVSYGYSTKRTTNAQLGAFGIGSKSALASVDTFRIISIKDGFKHTAIVDKDAKGVGQITFRSSKPTTEGNGVTVVIPVSVDDIDSYAEQASYLYQLWTPGSVLVNGRQPQNIVERGYQQAGELGYIAKDSNSYSASVRVNMGGLLYKVEGLDYSKRNHLFRHARVLQTKDVVINVPVGTVTVAPSREAILSNESNLRVVSTGVSTLYKYLVDNAQKEIEAAPNAFEAMKVMATFDFLGLGKFSYKGKEYESSIQATDMDVYMWETEQGRRKKTNSTQIGAHPTMSVSAGARKILVIDTRGAVTPRTKAVSALNTVRKMFPEFAVKRSFYVGDFAACSKGNIFIESMVDNGLIKVLPADKLMEDVTAFRKANRAKSSGGTRGAITYPVYFHNGKVAEDEVIADYEELSISDLRGLDNDSVFVHHLNTNSTNDYAAVETMFKKYGTEGEALVIVSSNRSSETLERRIGKDIEVKAFAQEFGNRARAELVEVKGNLEHAIRSGYNSRTIDVFFDKVMASDVEIQSPLFKSVAVYKTETISNQISENRIIAEAMIRIGQRLTEDENKKFLSINEDADEDVATKFWNTYSIARNMLDTWNPTSRQARYAAKLINEIFADEGDPTL